MKKYEELKAMVEAMAPDAEKVYEKGNRAAGTRVRKGLMEIKNHVHEMRKEITSLNK